MEVVVTTGAIRCKSPVKSSSPTKQDPTFYRPDALPVAKPTALKRIFTKNNLIKIKTFVLKLHGCSVTVVIQ